MEGATVAKVTMDMFLEINCLPLRVLILVRYDWPGISFCTSQLVRFGRLSWNNQMTSEQIADNGLKWLLHYLFWRKQRLLQIRCRLPIFNCRSKKWCWLRNQTAVDLWCLWDYTIFLPGCMIMDRNLVWCSVHVLIGCQSIITMQMQRSWFLTVLQLEVSNHYFL